MKKVLLIIMIALLLPLGTQASTATSTTLITEKSVFRAVNAERIMVGVPKLKREKALDNIAEEKLNDIIEYNYWSHNNPVTGSTPWTWFKKNEYEYAYAGENLATGFSNLDCLMHCLIADSNGNLLVVGWMSSDTHKKNIISTHFTHTGIAMRGSLVVQVFASKPEIKK